MTALPAARPFFGWRVVAATFLLAVFGWGVGFYGPPIYLHAVVARAGWPVTLVSTAVTVHFLFGALVVANLPWLHRALGVPRATLLGAMLLAIGVAGWATAGAPWQLFTAALASGGGWVAMEAAAVDALVAPWFVRNRPAALGMAYNGASVGGVVFSPLWVALIGGLGFLTASLAVGLVMTAVVGLAMGSATLAAIADRRLVACASLGVQVLGSLVLAAADGGADGGAGLLAGILLFGLGIGNATSLPPLIAQAEFRTEDAARVVPLIVAIGQAAYAFAPAAFGLLRAGPGVEPEAGLPLFLAAALVQGAAIAGFLWGRNPCRPAAGDNI